MNGQSESLVKKMKTIIEPDTYRKVKNMGYGQFSAFLNRIYCEAYKDGQNAAEGLGTADVKKVLLSVKGVGEKTAEQIVDAINKMLDEELNIEWICGSCGKNLSSVKGARYCPYCGSELNWEE